MGNKNEKAVAYFSAEYAIADDLPIYAGGLGILAGDIVLEAGMQNREFYAVGLVYHQAFTGDDPDQRPMTQRLMANGFELATRENGERLTTSVLIERRQVTLQAWVKKWGNTRLILLDSRVDENDERDRAICDRLYPSDPELQLAQELCLGFGGSDMLCEMGKFADIYHLNEGHAAHAGLALALTQLKAKGDLNFEQAVAQVRTHIVGTKHTILPGAGLVMSWEQAGRLISPTLERYGATLDDLKGVAARQQGDYSDTKLLISLARTVNGVSKLHVALEKREHPESRLIAITNGIFPWRWKTAAWGASPLKYSDQKIWAIHCECRRELLDHVKQQTGSELDPDRLTVVWARRMTAYKRPALLVNDLTRLADLIRHGSRPVQFIVSGEANPTDIEGIELMNRIIETARRPDMAPSFAYLPQYNTVDAKLLVRGADLWLNTPIRGFEACGTSGMKASLNGVLQFSTNDGWIDEVDIGAIGWELPSRADQAIYDILDEHIAPLFYHRSDGVPRAWVKKMRAAIALSQQHFSSARMLDDYYDKLYKRTTAEVA